MSESDAKKPQHWPANRPPDQPTLEEQRAIWRKKYAVLDAEAGFEIGDNFEPFNQINDMFTRAFWDKNIRSPKTDAFFKGHRVAANPKKADGFRQRDMALRNAAWAVSGVTQARPLVGR